MPRKSALKKKTGEKTLFFARYDPKNTLVVQRAPKKPMLNKCYACAENCSLKKVYSVAEEAYSKLSGLIDQKHYGFQHLYSAHAPL